MMFNDMKINKHKAQLIFTSHDLSTMNSEVFRRDEIWFVTKRIMKNGEGKTPTEIAPGTKVYELAKYLPEEIKQKIQTAITTK